MEMTAYVLGMLTIVAVAMATLIVVGIVKIMKLNKQQEYLNSAFERTRSEIYDHMKDEYNNVWRQFERAGRDVTVVEQTLRNQIEETQQQLNRSIDEAHRDMGTLSNADRRYTDSRIDKLIDTYFEHVGAKTTSKKDKELIKG